MLALGAFSLIGCAASQSTDTETAERPNVLFIISIDDLNDWITPLGGRPQARRPNLERLAQEGVTFTRTCTASPGCNPSRAALLTGVISKKESRPETADHVRSKTRNQHWIDGQSWQV